jgi:cytochrome c
LECSWEKNWRCYIINIQKHLAAYDKEWTFEELNGFLIKPAKWIKGTKMAYAGLRKEKDRASVIKYLNQNSDNPLPLP